MKKLVNGFLFDTEAARSVFACNNGHSRKCDTYRGLTLYRNKGGRWFVHLEGDLPRFKCCPDHARPERSDIHEMMESDVFKFLEEFSDEPGASEAIKKYFGKRKINRV